MQIALSREAKAVRQTRRKAHAESRLALSPYPRKIDMNFPIIAPIFKDAASKTEVLNSIIFK